jgi:ribulose-5-phosphate 4-epimerase/fuculose-1-phosphate aldolase
MEGLVETTLGHVSLRVSDTHFLVRARRSTEHGLRFTTGEDITLADLDGHLHPGEPPIALPAELPIHAATLAAHPDSAAVVHALSLICRCAPSWGPTTSRRCGWPWPASPATATPA